jgi:DNA-binding transcriptional LysR family regulator
MDIATVDLNLLKVLDALLAENSVSGAARRLRLSQPAGSDLVMTVPHAIARTFQTNWPLRLFDPPLSIETFDMAMAWHPRTAGDMAIEWLRQLVRNVATTALT